jgi:hypothetical protein
MPYAGFHLNSEHTWPWVTAIGKFMINFGGVEFVSFLWIERLTDNELLREIATDATLSKRIQLIKKLVEQRELPKSVLNQVRSAWVAAETLSQLRNDIAHSPIIFGWHGPDEDRSPDFVGSLRLKKLKGKQSPVKPLVELKELDRGIDEAARIAQKLHELLERVAAT